MRRRKRAALLAAVAVLAATAGTAAAVGPLYDASDRSADLHERIDPSAPKNVILLIGDGTDENILTAARNYEKGAGGAFEALDNLPFVGDMTTYGLQVGPNPNDYPIAYVSDSAPTATAWSTGKKTVDGRVSQGPSSAETIPGEDYETVLEQYEDDGKLTGNVTTSALTDATPAAAASHINLRGCQGPEDMAQCAAARKAAGGKGSIAEQLVDNQVDVLLGGGYNRFDQSIDADPTKTVIDYAQEERGYRLLQTAGELDAITSLDGGPLLGLFAGQSGSEHMTPLYEPLVATAAGAGGPTTKCSPADRGNQPSLAQMTDKAIELLDNPKGFFLQVESAMVDKQEHGKDACGAIGDVVQLEASLQVALDYQKANPDTLVIVTGDHSHSTQIVPGPANGRLTATLQTADGDPMTLAYSTQTSDSSSATHTGSMIRVAASGPQAANVTGYIDQTDLYETLLGRTPDEIDPEDPPVPPDPPLVGIAAVGKLAGNQARKGIPFSARAPGADKVAVDLVKKGDVLASKKKNGPSLDGTLKPGGRLKSGEYKLVATAKGPGGKAVDTAKIVIRVKRKKKG